MFHMSGRRGVYGYLRSRGGGFSRRLAGVAAAGVSVALMAGCGGGLRGGRAIVEVLRELKERGRTTVVVHHDLATVPEYFDRVVILNKHLVAEGPTAEVFTNENLAAACGGSVSYVAGDRG